MNYIGNAIFQLGADSDLEKYLKTIQANAHQSLVSVGREDCFDKVEYFLNKPQEDKFVCGWKVGLS